MRRRNAHQALVAPNPVCWGDGHLALATLADHCRLFGLVRGRPTTDDFGLLHEGIGNQTLDRCETRLAADAGAGAEAGWGDANEPLLANDPVLRVKIYKALVALSDNHGPRGTVLPLVDHRRLERPSLGLAAARFPRLLGLLGGHRAIKARVAMDLLCRRDIADLARLAQADAKGFLANAGGARLWCGHADQALLTWDLEGGGHCHLAGLVVSRTQPPLLLAGARTIKQRVVNTLQAILAGHAELRLHEKLALLTLACSLPCLQLRACPVSAAL
mmetsp:Transcript_1375/g.3426  ORF Transcript_1375/g.3426 Transcript_1375/m.3426 type:complete len:274 (-) Transcript_1375:265-1086(-)